MEFLKVHRRPLLPALVSLLIVAGCSGNYRLDQEDLDAGSPWPYHRGELSSRGAAPNSPFAGKLDILWQLSTKDKPAGPLTIHHNHLVYPGSRRKIRFFDLERGFQAGHIKPKGSAQSGVVTRNNLAFFAMGPRKNLLRCVNLSNGKTVWQMRVNDASAGLLLVDDALIVGTTGGVVLALSHSSGETIWRFEAESKFTVPASYGDGVLFQPGDDGTLFALDITTGLELYRTDLDGPLVSATAISDLVFAADMSGNVYGIDKSSGDIVWTRAMSGPVWTAPAVSKGTVFVGHSGGEIVAMDAATGSILWVHNAVDVIRASPLVVGDYVVAGTLTGKLYSLRAADGSVVDETDLGNAVSTDPVTDGTRVYVVTDEGLLTCFGPAPPEENNSN